jgi:hypothetical protein
VNTERAVGREAFKSKRGCICKQRFFAPSAARGFECVLCPQGGECDGQLHLPYAPLHPSPSVCVPSGMDWYGCYRRCPSRAKRWQVCTSWVLGPRTAAVPPVQAGRAETY